MPSKSAKQARFMAAAAHDPKFAAKAGIKPSVAKEFNQADQGDPMKSAMKKMEKADAKLDKAKGIKENSPKDIKQDKKTLTSIRKGQKAY